MTSHEGSTHGLAASNGYVLRLPDGGALRVGGDRRALVMGILNVTPDSFSDGGMFNDLGVAFAHAESMAAEGADLIDVGGESTRPGSEPVAAGEQIRRVAPVIDRIASKLRVPVSIDTTSAVVAKTALDSGAAIINDISAMRDDPGLARLAAAFGAPVILMHMQGRPRDMQVSPVYRDVVAEVMDFLRVRIAAVSEAGVPVEQILVDPGFGFGKLLEHNLTLLRDFAVLKSLGRPLVAGTSRKAMIGKVLDLPAGERLYGTLATVAAAVERGAAVVRVHDVGPCAQVVRMLAAIHGRRND